MGFFFWGGGCCFLLFVDFLSYFCFCLGGTIKLGGEGDGQDLGEDAEGDKDDQNILY